MLKIVLWMLLVTNVVLFGLVRGGWGPTEVHEPQRVQNQVNADLIKIVPVRGVENMPAKMALEPVETPPAVTDVPSVQPQINVAQSAPAPTPTPDPKPAPTQLLACLETKSLSSSVYDQAKDVLSRSGLDGHWKERSEARVDNYIVFISGKDGKDGKAGARSTRDRLTALGVTDSYILPETSIFPWGVSLGVFSTEDAAKTQKERLLKQGATGITIKPYRTIKTHVIELHGVSRAQIKTFEKEMHPALASGVTTCKNSENP